MSSFLNVKLRSYVPGIQFIKFVEINESSKVDAYTFI